MNLDRPVAKWGVGVAVPLLLGVVASFWIPRVRTTLWYQSTGETLVLPEDAVALHDADSEEFGGKTLAVYEKRLGWIPGPRFRLLAFRSELESGNPTVTLKDLGGGSLGFGP